MSFNLYVEQEMVVQNVKKELYRWNSSYVPERLPSHPVELSYWVIQNLPLDDDLRLNLMGIDSAVQRLRCSLSIVQKVQTLYKVLYYCIYRFIFALWFSPFCTEGATIEFTQALLCDWCSLINTVITYVFLIVMNLPSGKLARWQWEQQGLKWNVGRDISLYSAVCTMCLM